MLVSTGMDLDLDKVDHTKPDEKEMALLTKSDVQALALRGGLEYSKGWPKDKLITHVIENWESVLLSTPVKSEDKLIRTKTKTELMSLLMKSDVEKIPHYENGEPVKNKTTGKIREFALTDSKINASDLAMALSKLELDDNTVEDK